jgi:transposase
MRRVIGMDVHRTFAEVVAWEDGRLRPLGRVDMTRSGLEGFGRTLAKTDEVVVEATGNAMAVVRVLSPYVARVIVANPLQVKAIAHARIKTDKIDAGVLAQLRAADFLPEVWLPDTETERRRRLVARRNQVVRHRTRVKNEVHAILQAHLIPPCPHSDLFGKRGRAWLERQDLPADETAAITRHLRELDRLGEDLDVLEREVAQAVVDDPAVKRLLTITGINLTVAAGLVAAIGDVKRFSEPEKLVSYFGLNPRVRQSGLGLAQHGRISKHGRAHARAMLVEAAWAASKAPGPLRAFFPADPRQAWAPSRRCGCRSKACRDLLAPAEQGNRLPLAAPGAGGPQGQIHGAAGWTAHAQGKHAWAEPRLPCQGTARPRDRGRSAGRACV